MVRLQLATLAAVAALAIAFSIKPGVDLACAQPRTILAMERSVGVFNLFGYHHAVTSVCDGVHQPNSFAAAYSARREDDEYTSSIAMMVSSSSATSS